MESSKKELNDISPEPKGKIEFNSEFIREVVKKEVKRIGINQEYLLVVALNSENSYFVRSVALDCIEDDSTLSLFIFNVNDWRKNAMVLALEALNKINDQDMIIEIALSDSDYHLGQEAVKKIKDVETIKTIIATSKWYGDQIKWILEDKSLSSEVIAAIVEGYEYYRIYDHLILKHPNTGPDTLEIFAKDEFYSTRKKVAEHPNAKKDTLERLAQDEDEEVRKIAEQRLLQFS